MRTARQLFDDAKSSFPGVSERAFGDKSTLIGNAIREVKAGGQIDIPETKRIMPLKPLVGAGDMLYAVPEDMESIIDLIPAKGFQDATAFGYPLNPYQRTSNQTLDREVGRFENKYSLEYRMGIPVLRLHTGAQLNEMGVVSYTDRLSDPDTGLVVTGGGDTVNLGTSGAWSVVAMDAWDFGIKSTSGGALIQELGGESSDLSPYGRDGTVVINLFIPEELVGLLDKVELIFTDDNAQGMKFTTEATAYGGGFVAGYNQLSFPLTEGALIGVNFNWGNIVRKNLGLLHSIPSNEVVNGLRVSGMGVYRGQGLLLEYYSKFNFKDINGKFLEQPVSSGLTEECLFNNDTYHLVVHELRKAMDEARSGDQTGTIWRNAQRALFGLQGVSQEEGAYQRYRRSHPSSRPPQITKWA